MKKGLLFSLLLAVIFVSCPDFSHANTIFFLKMDVENSTQPILVIVEEIRSTESDDVIWVSSCLSQKGFDASDFISAIMDRFDEVFGYGRSSLGRDVFIPDMVVWKGEPFAQTIVLTPRNVRAPKEVLDKLESGLDILLVGVQNLSGEIFTRQAYVVNVPEGLYKNVADK